MRVTDAAPSACSVAVVVGASGGVGRALTARLAQDPAYDRVFALSRRRPDDWHDSDRQAWRPVDILDEASLRAASNDIAEHGAPTRIIVATGLLHAAGLSPEKSMSALNANALTRLFAVNAVGPALVAKHFLPLTPRERPSLFAVLSARVGSIGDNRLGGWYGYRASKAALNMLIRSLAIEHQRRRPLSICVALHPGTVATTLSAPFRSGATVFGADQSAVHLLEVMDALRPSDSGGFFAWDGQTIAW